MNRKSKLLPPLGKAAWGMWAQKNYFVSITILPPLNCHLSCEHCYAESLKDPGRTPMTPEQVEAVLDMLYRYGIFQFEFQGGEPLLPKHLPRYVNACRPDRSPISITANGILLTEEDRAYSPGLHDSDPQNFNRYLWNWFGHYSCPAAKFNVIVTPYGDVIPCPFIQASYENLLEEHISEIHARMMSEKYFKDRYEECPSSEKPGLHGKPHQALAQGRTAAGERLRIE